MVLEEGKEERGHWDRELARRSQEWGEGQVYPGEPVMVGRVLGNERGMDWGGDTSVVDGAGVGGGDAEAGLVLGSEAPEMKVSGVAVGFSVS